ncbi:hypothetical protein BR93DRAFT_445259 [Coniochaeta sp. PMI_546]|nr:hypothetical protein BR93DRAFT_445259 [Coniochaeta sp. PMI_546]
MGTNTANTQWPTVEGWTLWRDFTTEKLHAMFADIVEADWTITTDLHAPVTHWNREFFGEDGLEHTIISTHILPPVNAALQHAVRYRKLDQAFSLSISRAGRTYYEPGGDRRFKTRLVYLRYRSNLGSRRRKLSLSQSRAR